MTPGEVTTALTFDQINVCVKCVEFLTRCSEHIDLTSIKEEEEKKEVAEDDDDYEEEQKE